MPKKGKRFFTRSKVWIEDDKGNVVFGMGRLRMLRAVQEHGSINAAAKALGMNYRAVWARINAAEKRLGKNLLEKKTGGKAGGGSRLTPLAEALIKHFCSISDMIEEETDKEFEKELKGMMKLNS